MTFLAQFLAEADFPEQFFFFFFFACVFLGSIRYPIMGNAAGSMEVPQGKESRTVSAPPGSTGSQKRTVGLKLPMPPEEELEQRFSAVLVSCSRSGHMSAFTQKQNAQGKEFGICWKCARPQDKLITVPGTQCHCRKIHKRSFILELTAALGSLHGLLEDE